MSSSRLVGFLLLSSSLLAACGGGGSNDPGNQAPQALAGADQAVVEGSTVTLDGGASFDADGTIRDYEWLQIGGPAVTLADADTEAASFTAPSTDATLTLDFRLNVTDNRGASASDEVRVTVTPENTPVNAIPVAADDTATTNEDNAVTVDVLANDSDADGASDLDPASIAVANVQNGSAAVDAGKVVFTPAANFNGTGGFSYTVRDRQGAQSNVATATITVTPVNDAPVANAASGSGQRNQAISGQLSGSDIDGDALSFAKASDPAHGSVTVSTTGSYTYTPAPGYTGTDSFSFTVSDGIATSAPATVSLTITSPGNAAPRAFDDGAITDEDTPVTIDVLANDVDTDSGLDPASITIVSQDQGVATVAGGKVSFLADANYFGTDAGFTYTVDDTDGSTSNVATVAVTVNPVNDAPVASDAAASGDEEATIAGTVSGSDVDGDTLTFAKASDPAHGTVEMTSQGAFTYTPAANFAGTDSFTFTASDGSAISAPATVTLTVADQPEATVSVGDVTVAEDAGSMVFTVTLSRSPDTAVAIRYATADGTARAGSDYAAASGELLFEGDTLSQDVTVPVSDDAVHEDAETLTLTLEATQGADSLEPGSDFDAAGTITDNDPEDTTSLRIGAAKRSIQPAQAHIDGIVEPRAFGAGEHLQKFNLGGFGINPLSNVPDDPAGFVQMGGEALTEPASQRVYTNAAGVEESTTIRALAVQQPGGDTVVFLMMDAVGAGNIIQKGVKSAVVAAAADAGVTLLPENILFGQTHTHAGADLQGLWGGVPQAWINDVLYPQAAAAVREALENRQPAALRLRQGSTSEFNNYRRPRIEPSADADSTITLVEATALDGTPIGSILGYNAHPTSVNVGGARTPHPDYILGAQDWLEARGGIALYYNGPIADASGSGSRAGCVGGNTYANVRCRGEGMADYLLHDANATANRELAPTVTARSVEVYLPVTNPGFLAFGLTGSFNRYYNFMDVATDMIPGIEPYLADLPQLTPVARTHVSRVTLGGADGLEIVTIPGEATNTFGQYIRSLAGTNVMLLGLTHNSFGYILPEDEFSYVDQTGDTGLVLPFTGYEEMVSLGPLTAPMLRTQGYNVLFGAGAADGGSADIPPAIAACVDDSAFGTCLLETIQNRIDRFVEQWIVGGAQQLSDLCHDNAGDFEAICVVPDTVAGLFGEVPAPADPALVMAAAEAQIRGCDPLDPANCLYPFPNDWFTAEAVPGTIQHADRGGTGRRVNLNPLATPRNSAGKPVDPTEWNRSDGFSPGALVTTFVPGLSLEQTHGLASREIGVANLALSQSADAPILVLEVQDDGSAPVRHLVWSEIDQNANLLTIAGAPNVGTFPIDGVTNEHGHVSRPQNDGKAALLIRPGKNFAEGKRYVVVLRKLKDAAGNAIAAQAGFRACVAGDTALLPVQARCEQLQDKVFPVLEDAGIALDDSLYLAWDFTVESTESAIGRLRHMRDDAFATLSSDPAGEDCTQLTAANAATCAAPAIEITNVIENPQGGIARRIEGMLTVPNYLAPVAPSPVDNAAVAGGTSQLCANAPEGEFASGCSDLRDGTDIAQGATLPNRLFYSPADGTSAPDANNPFDPTGLRYGDGLPDRNGTMTTRFLCQIPAQATPDAPARASLYGHGQLDRGVAITYEGTPDVAREHNYMFCAVDWFGFRTGDAVNVASSLVDLSNFPVVPDASQQGMLNFMFLARAMQHPRGLGALPEFQDPASGRPLFDRSEIFYNGNSQGGIFGGVVLAASKDVNRGVLGSLGMNYSTLLTRSKNFDEYAGVLYTSYTDPLDRQLLFSMMQMLWDRSENNGYAHHIADNTAFGGPANVVKLDPMFGDPQVTMFSAEVMARTMGVPFDNRQTLRVETLGAQYLGANGRRHPAVVPYEGLEPLAYGTDAVNGSALMVWDTNHAGDFAHIPPITNTPPRTGPDPHDASQKAKYGRCQMAHFLRTGGELIDILPVQFDGAACPAVPAAAPTVKPDDEPPAPSTDLYGTIIGAIDALLSSFGQGVADAYATALQAAGDALGISLPPPGVTPVDNPAPQPLMAGAAKRPIQVPVGVPLGGYLRPPVGGEYIGDDPAGEITDNAPSANDGCDPTAPDSCIPNAPLPDEARAAHSPYATFSPPTRGYYDSLIAKAVALYDGHDYVVMVKTDFIGMLDEVVQDVKAEVKARKGIDLGDGLIMSATHSHDGPGAIANHSTRYFWLAMDTYQHDLYLRIVYQLADVVVAALDDLKPARIGHGNGIEAPQAGNGNGINGYRRGRLDSYDDDDRPGCAFVPAEQCPAGIDDANELRKRIGVLRVDDAATGAPIAVVINFADHGIAFDVENQYFSGDVLGSIEREVEQSFVKPAGDDAFRAPIAMLVQNTGGDVTPKNVQYSIRGIEMLGKRMAPQVRAVTDAIDRFQDAPDLRTVSQRVILNRERLGYEGDEYPYAWGAAQCGNDLAVPFADVGVNDIPGYGDTGLPRKHPYCIPAPAPDPEDLADNGVAENGAFVPGDTILSAVKIGGITLLVQPGEPLTEYGVRALEMAQAEGFTPADTFVWGYAADHIGYILPPVEEDWATFGGAESTTTFWGWKQGQRFIDGHRELLRALRDGTPAPADEFQIDYSLGKQMYASVPGTPSTPSALPGAVVAQPADIVRFGKTVFTWEGGDPVLDFPGVVLQHADGTPVRRANGEIIDTFFEMHLKYRLVSGRHLWTVEFEAPKDWAAGEYRFAVTGKAFVVVEGLQGGSGPVPYALESRAFSVAVATNLEAQGMTCADGTCSVTVKYRAVPSNYRIVDANVDPGQAAPMRTGTVTFTNGSDSVVAQADGSGTFSAAIGGIVTANAVDAYGNTAPAVTAGGTPPVDQDGDGVPDAADQCPTEAGPASNNGCPEGGEPPAFPVELCEPFAGYCLEDIPVLGPALQGAIDAAWATINGGGAEPPPVDPPSELPGTGTVESIVADAAAEVQTLPADVQAAVDAVATHAQAGTLANRAAEAVVMEGRNFPDWSQPAAQGISMPYPNGALTGERDAHAGVMLYPPAGFAGLPTAVPADEIVAFARLNDAWVEIPVQVDERFPYFLANPNSDFGIYSGTDTELTYAWDRETWKADGVCEVDEASVAPTADPVPGLDDDDEIVFMAQDAGELADPALAGPDGTTGGGQEIALVDPLDPDSLRYVYLYRRAGGSSFAAGHYVEYVRDANADQFVDRGFWRDDDPEKIGTSNTGYGPNLPGTVCPDGTDASARQSNDRFPRDGVTIRSDRYQIYASGRWMVRSVQIAKPDASGAYGADIMDRWKGRAFQQSPDSNISVVGFEDEQVNWEANSALLGERAGPVRAIREVWGADSGTNVTKTETYYRDAYSYRYRVRVHPIPPDGLYTSWDYNRGAMVPTEAELAAGVQGGRYYTAVRGAGVPIDGRNDDIGNIDGHDPIPGLGCPSPDDSGFIPPNADGSCPAYFDVADPLLNLPLTMYNWEQVSAKGDLGSLVYLFELKSPTIGANAAAIPYYRDDACLDDGTGDDPVQRPYPGERATDARVIAGYVAANGGAPYESLGCEQKQGAHAQHGVHFLMPPESDNATAPVPVNEIDGQQWAFVVPTEQPTNVGDPYANIVRVPLVKVVRPRPAAGGGVPGVDLGMDYASCVAMAQQGGAEDHEAAAKFACAIAFGGGDADGDIQGPTDYVEMDDGTLIAANIYIPWSCNVAMNPDAHPCASILEMSGYDGGSDDGPTPSSDFEDILTEESGIDGVMPLQGGSRAANNKYYRSDDRYVSVVASVRGTGCSSGEFDLFSRKSAMDGHQLVEWMADQPWSNGKVGLFGHSYSGITAAMIASTAPPSLRMATVSGQIGDLYRDIVYPGGVSNYGFPLLWTGGIRVIADVGGGQLAGIFADTQDRQCAQNVATHTRTVTDDPLVNGLGDTDSPWYYERSVVNYLHQVTVPFQVVTAYQDEQTGPRGGTHVFDKLPQNLTRRLVMLNGNHGSQVAPPEVTAERRWWMDHFMLDANDPIATRRPRNWAPGSSGLAAPQVVAGQASSRVLLEVSNSLGRKSNGHIDSNGFPLSQTQWHDYYFQAAGQLDDALPTVNEGEDGASSSYISGSKRQAYSYTANGYIGNDDSDTPVSVTDASGVDELVFAMPVTEDLVFAGPVTANLFLSSTGADTELMVQLIDRDPATGERLYLQRGVLKASHRAITAQHSQCAQQGSGGRITSRDCALSDNLYRPYRPHDSATDLITPGQIVNYRLEIFPVGHVLRAGHELVVKLHAPSLDDNDWAYIAKTAPALNTLFHSAQHPSSLKLPLIALADVQRLGAPTGTCDDSAMRCVIEDHVPNPPATLAAQCYAYGEAYDPSGGAFTEAFCGFVATIADAFGDGASQIPADDAIGQVAVGAATATGAAGGAIAGATGEEEGPLGQALAGVGVVDMTPDVGYGAGQYTDSGPFAYGVDPYMTGKKQKMSYGVMSRATGRAIVVEGGNGKRIALLKSDNYLAQDALIRRVAQILGDEGSSIGYDQILYGVTHAHSTTYASTPSAGVAAFQDVFDPRQFEFQARKLAQAVLIAERNMVPARMGATTVRHKIFKGQIMGPSSADDGTPAQYPNEYGDNGLVVMRLENAETGDAIAAWINWGEHPEGLDGYDLHSADFVGFLERFVERDLGVPLVYSQGDVGSAEKSGNTSQRIRDDGTVCNDEPGETCEEGQGVWRDWNHAGYVQNERNARFLADAVIKGWHAIGGDTSLLGGDPRANNHIAEVQVPLSGTFPVDYRNAWVPGPISHPYPAVSNCRSEPTVGGDVGVPVAGLPDCAREGFPGDNPVSDQLALVVATLKAEGVPVPDHYDAPSFGALEENARLKLQAFRLGEMVLGSCACEAQVDLILNFESRANDVAGDIYDGFDWACVAEDKGLLPKDEAHAEACALQREKYFDVREFPTHVPGSNFSAAAIARMRAQVHNPADGWDAPEYAPYANTEPADPALIKGNFTKEELAPAHGYRLAVGVGHAGDYNGYTVSYREYVSHDHYRKALTAYGAHTADYMVTRLVRMAGAMKGAAELKPEPHDSMAQADEARQVAQNAAFGQATKNAYDAYFTALPPDAGVAEALVQPRDTGLFNAATFTWRGGATAIDNPRAVVEREVNGAWQFFADQTGEVQTRVQWPTPEEAATVYAGQFEWKWTANFEAYQSFPASLGGTPPGRYRFVVEGCINSADAPEVNLTNRAMNFLAGILPAAVSDGLLEAGACRGGASAYALASDAFEVLAQRELVSGVSADALGNLTISVAPTSIPKTYASAFPYVTAANDNGRFCEECSFRPWATSTAPVVSVTVTANGQTFTAAGSGATWTAPTGLATGQQATIVAAYADGEVSRAFTYTFTGATTPPSGGDDEPSDAPQLCAPDQVPEIGGECLADNGGAPVQDAVDEAWDTLTGGF